MSKSDHPLIIGSGTQHSVSVSEHTGNASTPKNKVRSGAEKKSEKVAVNDEAEHVGKTTVKVDPKQDEQLTGNLIVTAANSENIQTVEKGPQSNNSQKIEGEALNELSSQELKNDAEKENFDGIHKAASATVQNLKVIIEPIRDNIQAINTDIASENIQEISIDKVLESSAIKLSGKLESENKAEILTDNEVDNLQKISAEKHTDLPEPRLGKDSILDNTQEVKLDKQEKNIQKLKSNIEPENIQKVDVDGLVDNLHKIPKEKESLNVQALPIESKSNPDRPELPNKSKKNPAQLEGDNDMAKFHTPTEPHGVGNSQPIVKVEHEENRQLIDTPHSESYKVPAAEAIIPYENKQPIAKEDAQDHTEGLPIDKAERSNNAIGVAVMPANLSIGKVKKSNPQVFKNDEKLAEIKAKVEAINSEMANVNSQLDALIPQNEESMQSLREKQREAFLGRVARMKGDVASVNQQLNVLEDMAGLKSKKTG